MLISVFDHLYDLVPGPASDGGVQRSLDLARDGDRVYLPGGIPGPPITPGHYLEYSSPSFGWKLRKSVTMYGDGRGHQGTYLGTTLVPTLRGDEGGNVLVIDPLTSLDHVFLRDFKITKRQSQQFPTDGYDGISCFPANAVVGALRLERLNILNLVHDGYAFAGANLSSATIERLLMMSCGVTLVNAIGIRLANIRHAVTVRTGATSSVAGGWLVEQSAISLFSCTAEANLAIQLLFRACLIAEVDACHFEKFGADGTPMLACAIEGVTSPALADGPAWIAASNFPSGKTVDGVGVGAGTAISVASSLLGPAAIMPNRHTRVTVLVDVSAPSSGLTVLPQFTDARGGGDEELRKGEILVPSLPSEIAGSVTISRIGVPTEYAGLILPSLAADPTSGGPIQDGMLYYDTTNDRFRVRIAGAWRTIQTSSS